MKKTVQIALFALFSGQAEKAATKYYEEDSVLYAVR